MKRIFWLNNEDGSVLIVALVMLVLLTVIGISATTTSEIETMIAGNERVFKRNLYLAEGGAMQSAQDLEERADPQADEPNLNWLHDKGVVDEPYVRNDSNWTDANSEKIIDLNTTRFMVSSEGLAGGSKGTSLNMTKSNVHAYNLYGRWYDSANSAKGRLIIQVGYRKAF